MKTKHCEWCDNAFETNVSYQIYCSAECRESATREKITQRYIAGRIKKRLSKDRRCKSCGGKLSIYNDDPICGQCLINPKDVSTALKEIKDFKNGKFE
jgi:hypothetical protein